MAQIPVTLHHYASIEPMLIIIHDRL